MDTIEILRTVSKLVYENVKDLAGTAEAASGDFGRGAGGDISRNIDMIAEKTVIDYLKEINFDCVILGEECGRVELSSNPKGFIIMDAIDGSAKAVRGMPFFCCSLAFSTVEDCGEEYWRNTKIRIVFEYLLSGKWVVKLSNARMVTPNYDVRTAIVLPHNSVMNSLFWTRIPHFCMKCS